MSPESYCFETNTEENQCGITNVETNAETNVKYYYYSMSLSVCETNVKYHYYYSMWKLQMEIIQRVNQMSLQTVENTSPPRGRIPKL